MYADGLSFGTTSASARRRPFVWHNIVDIDPFRRERRSCALHSFRAKRIRSARAPRWVNIGDFVPFRICWNCHRAAAGLSQARRKRRPELGPHQERPNSPSASIRAGGHPSQRGSRRIGWLCSMHSRTHRCNGAAVPLVPSGEQPGARTSDARIRGASHSAFKGGRAEERAFAHHLAVTAFVVVDRAFSVRGRESAVIGVKQERTREHLCIMHKCPFARCDACSPVAIARKTGTVNSSRGGSP